jgi:hypothetical protein
VFAKDIPHQNGLVGTLYVKFMRDGEFFGEDQVSIPLFSDFGVSFDVCIYVDFETRKISQDVGCIIEETVQYSRRSSGI